MMAWRVFGLFDVLSLHSLLFKMFLFDAAHLTVMVESLSVYCVGRSRQHTDQFRSVA